MIAVLMTATGGIIAAGLTVLAIVLKTPYPAPEAWTPEERLRLIGPER